MAFCRREGKDTVVFVTKEDHEKPCTVEISAPELSPGLILEDGSINWNCPCLGGMPTGPCGVEFRDAFNCFHYSTSEPKGTECFSVFQQMQNCMRDFPNVYKNQEDDEVLQMVEGKEDDKVLQTVEEDTDDTNKFENKVSKSSKDNNAPGKK